jgi:nicotinamidase-related amidase
MQVICASDLGYQVVMVEDGFCNVRTTDDVLEELHALAS